MIKRWLGDTRCNLCGMEVSAVGDFCYDAVMNTGQWAFMCEDCWKERGKQFGQEYDAKTLDKIRDLVAKQ